MAARAWVVALVGFFAVWVMFQVVGWVIAVVWSVWQELDTQVTGTMIEPTPEWRNTLNTLYNSMITIWNYMPVIILLSAAIYIILESLRRRPEDYYV